MLQQAVSYIDFHDARIGRISLLSGGNVEIEFEHLCSYHENGQESGEVWSSKAIIGFTGVNQLEVKGSIGRKDYVTEWLLLDEQQMEISLLPIGSEKQARSLNLLLAGSGTKIRISMETATLVRLDPTRKLEDWPD